MRRALLSIVALLLSACDPAPATELDGAYAGNPELSGAPTPGGSLPDVGAAAPPPAAARPVLGIHLPAGVQMIEHCEAVIAADYDKPPKMACLLFQTEDAVKGQLDAGVFVAISEAGWNQVRVQGDQHYFERPRAGTECSDVAVVSVLTDRVQAVVDHAGAGKSSGKAAWQAYSIPASTHQACGADRMKP